MLDWIKKNKQFLSIEAINKALTESTGMPQSYIQKAVDGSQKLPKKWIKPLNKFISELRK